MIINSCVESSIFAEPLTTIGSLFMTRNASIARWSTHIVKSTRKHSMSSSGAASSRGVSGSSTSSLTLSVSIATYRTKRPNSCAKTSSL